jgi:hypothetical protein
MAGTQLIERKRKMNCQLWQNLLQCFYWWARVKNSLFYFRAWIFCEEKKRSHCHWNLLPTRLLLFPENQRYKNKMIAPPLIVRVDAALKLNFLFLLKLVKKSHCHYQVFCFSPDSMGFIQM